MNTMHVSRACAKSLIVDNTFKDLDFDFISISDTHSEAEEMRELWKSNKKDSNAAIFIVARDTVGADSGFDYIKSEQILNFAKISKMKGKNIIVHCFAGISRSAAVAKVLQELYGDKESSTYEAYEHYTIHNQWWYNMLKEQAGLPTMRSYYADLEMKSYCPEIGTDNGKES